jgi:hypothetical protein
MQWLLLEIYYCSCEILGLQESFNGACFGPAFSKTCQYVTIDEKTCKNLRYVSIKTTQEDLQKCIIWSKISRKGRQNGPKLVLKLRFILENSIPLW